LKQVIKKWAPASASVIPVRRRGLFVLGGQFMSQSNSTVYPTSATTKAARLFVQTGRRIRNAEEQSACLRAYLLKSKACAIEIVAACAGEMGRLIAGEDCTLIPVPDSNGCTIQNRRLCDAIARHEHAGYIQVADILTRDTATESQCGRHCKGKAPLPPEHLNISVIPHKPFRLTKIYFVDNVITSGATIQACHNALGFGTGLVYAEARRRHCQRNKKAYISL